MKTKQKPIVAIWSPDRKFKIVRAVRKDQIRIRLDSQSLLLRLLIEMLIKEGVINEQQLHGKLVSRGLDYHTKELRDLLRLLNTL